jgi:dTDP-4-amino-4,6-dideoxygalactose transaminase
MMSRPPSQASQDSAAQADRKLVPLNDLARQTAALEGALSEATERVLTSGRYILGAEVAAFEAEFAAYCGVSHCVGVANGTEALELALRAVGVRNGDEVVTVANAGMYTSAAAIAVGARPVFADIEEGTMTMAPASLAAAITDKTAAIVITHLYGRMADVEPLTSIARRRDIPVVEDCAQTHGARLAGRAAGSWGLAGCFSFYPTKNLGAIGDAGAVVTSSKELAASVRELRQYGWKAKYVAERSHGRNSRLDEMQAAVLRVKLPHLDRWNARRREIVTRYRDAAGSAVLFQDAAGPVSAAHLCVVRSPDRKRLREALLTDGIATDIHYPTADHHQPALREYVRNNLLLPITDGIVREVVTLPCFPELTESEVARVCASLQRFPAL